MNDEIVAEVRMHRGAYGERFDFDLEAIFRDLGERERVGGREIVSLPPRRIDLAVDGPLVDLIEAIPATGPSPAATHGS